MAGKAIGTDGNMRSDKVVSVLAALLVALLAVWKVEEYVNMPTQTADWAAAGVFIGLLLFLITAPMFRK